MLFLRFWTNWPTLLKKNYLSATLIIMLTTKCRTNLILDKTNKMNSLQYFFFFAELIFLFVISFSFSSGSLIVRFWKLDLFSGNSRVRKNKNLFYFAL